MVRAWLEPLSSRLMVLPDSSAGSTSFLGLSDTPSSFSGASLKGVRVNVGESALEFFTLSGDTDELVKVSVNDSTAGFLNGKLVAGTGITLTENLDGGNESLSIISNITQYSDELAQDAIGTILIDSTSINFTYDDDVPSITGVVLPGGVDHNSLFGLQGGTIGEYYHLTSLEYGFVNNISLADTNGILFWNGSNIATDSNFLWDSTYMKSDKPLQFLDSSGVAKYTFGYSAVGSELRLGTTGVDTEHRFRFDGTSIILGAVPAGSYTGAAVAMGKGSGLGTGRTQPITLVGYTVDAGGAQAGFGAGYNFKLQNTTPVYWESAQFGAEWINPTAGAEEAQLYFAAVKRSVSGTPQEVMTISQDDLVVYSSAITFDVFSTAGFLKNDVNGVLSGGNSVSLTTDVTGTLAVGNGGTGATTFTANGVLTGNLTGAIQAEANMTFDGDVLTLSGGDGMEFIMNEEWLYGHAKMDIQDTGVSVWKMEVISDETVDITHTNGNYVLGNGNLQLKGRGIFNLDGGSVSVVDADNVAIFSNTSATTDDAEITIQSGTIGSAFINLGDTADEDIGYIQYNNSVNVMYFAVSAVQKTYLSSVEFSPSVADGLTLGSASREWQDLYFTPPSADTAGLRHLIFDTTTNRVSRMISGGVSGTFQDLAGNNITVVNGIIVTLS